MGNGYKVVYDSASAAADATSTKVDGFDSVQTSITEAITSAEGALPTEFTVAIGRLKVLRETHVDDVKDIKAYAAGAVSSLKECLKTYETTSADMVAETWKLENKVAFDHSTIFGQTEDKVNDTIGEKSGLKDLNDDGLPSRDEGRSEKSSYSSTEARDGSSESTTSTHSSTRGGSTNSTSDNDEYGTSNGVTTSERTYSSTHTSNGVTDTTSQYQGSSFGPGGRDESTATGSTYTVEGDGQKSTTTSGTTKVPVAR